ncbi:MAG: helix-turn-helix domain-containing protein [Sedimentisphaerales bacterium]|nr:helix-turn-helix domain-containing protein [Sedimentisphaerales bacterium]
MNNPTPQTIYQSDGKPVAFLMTEDELVKFLRLDQVNIQHPADTLRRYRDAGRLKGIQISKQILYRLPDVLEFLERQKEAVAR